MQRPISAMNVRSYKQRQTIMNEKQGGEIMFFLGLLAGFVLSSLVVVITVSACMLSSQISQADVKRAAEMLKKDELYGGEG